MRKRIVLHTADWHLGKNRKYADYLEQQRLMLKAILAMTEDVISEHTINGVLSENVEIWLVMAGDIFDRNEDTDREEFILPIISIIYPLIELKKKHKNFDFFFVDGNHDRQPYDPTDPHAMASVASPLLKMIESHIAVDKPKWIEDKKLLLVPFGQHTVESIHGLLKDYPSQFMVMHECCAGITTDVGWKPPRDQDHYIDAGELIKGAPDLVAVFLGDIHRSQKLDQYDICWYSGSPITLDHGHKMPKGILIHNFVDKGVDEWKREGEPELRSLLKYEPELKFHVQLGILDNPDFIPFDTLRDYSRKYIQFTVTAEVYALIARQLPQLFESPTVSWEYKNEDVIATPNKEEWSEEQSQIDYYRPLLEQWILENGKELTKQEQQTAISRILKDFESRI
jgi:DNA repair exonuclease SbcCD nuclease subunit